MEMPVGDAVEREAGGLDVLRVGGGRVAPERTRELVEGDQEGEAASGGLGPVIEAAGGGGEGHVGEAVDDRRVHPALHAFGQKARGLRRCLVAGVGEPEVEHVGRVGGLQIGTLGSSSRPQASRTTPISRTMPDEVVGRVRVRIRLVGYRHAEMRAERLPAIPEFVDQQPVRRHLRLHGGDIGLVDRHAMGAVGRSATEDPQGDELTSRRAFLGLGVGLDDLEDGLLVACPPAFGGAPGQEDAGVREGLDELRPVVGRWPVDAGAVLAQQEIPVRRSARHHVPPELLVLRVADQLPHVVAGSEAEDLQRLTH